MDVRERLARYDACLEEGRLADAETLLTDSLQEARDREEYGAELTFYNELEGLYRTTGRAARASEISGEALQLIRELGLEGSMPHGTTLLNGATANRMAGNLEKALQMYQQAEQIFQAQGQEKSYYMTALYNNISQVYQEMEEPGQALAYQQKALAQIRRLSDSEAELATTQVNISLSLMALGRLEEAEEALDQALAYYDSEAGQRDPHYGSALSAAGELACRRERYEEAAAKLERALQLTLRYYGENDACRILRGNLALVREKAEKVRCGS